MARVIANGIWLVVAGLTLPILALGQRGVAMVAAALIAANYAFVVEIATVAWLIVAAVTPAAIHANPLVVLSSVVFAVGSLVATVVMLDGARRALREA